MCLSSLGPLVFQNYYLKKWKQPGADWQMTSTRGFCRPTLDAGSNCQSRSLQRSISGSATRDIGCTFRYSMMRNYMYSDTWRLSACRFSGRARASASLARAAPKGLQALVLSAVCSPRGCFCRAYETAVQGIVEKLKSDNLSAVDQASAIPDTRPDSIVVLIN